MNRTLAMTGKELRSYFGSLSAYIFIILFATLSTSLFFLLEEFFGNGRAEIRTFFAWIPGIFAILIPGITMRQWAREREMRSDELLMTLPARTHELVIGKFLATLTLIAVGLLFTVGIPLTAAIYGDLDSGPVVGGYLAAILLGSAFAAIGIFISSWFTEQFLAWVVSVLACLGLAVMSHSTVLEIFKDAPPWITDVLSFVGFWKRFAAIERGVLDFRDIGYYLSITGLFLFLNVVVLRVRRWA